MSPDASLSTLVFLIQSRPPVSCKTELRVPCTLYNVYRTVSTAQCTVYAVHCKLCSVQCTLYTVHSTLNSVQCILYNMPDILGVSDSVQTGCLLQDRDNHSSQRKKVHYNALQCILHCSLYSVFHHIWCVLRSQATESTLTYSLSLFYYICVSKGLRSVIRCSLVVVGGVLANSCVKGKYLETCMNCVWNCVTPLINPLEVQLKKKNQKTYSSLIWNAKLVPKVTFERYWGEEKPIWKIRGLTTVFRCLSPFEIETHISLEWSAWADFSWKTFKNK